MLICAALLGGLSGCALHDALSDGSQESPPDTLEEPDIEEFDAEEPEDARSPAERDDVEELEDIAPAPELSLELSTGGLSYRLWAGSGWQELKLEARDENGEAVQDPSLEDATISWALESPAEGPVELGECTGRACQIRGEVPGEARVLVEVSGWPPLEVEVEVLGLKEVAAGARFSCAIDTRDALYCWGYNTHGNLGDESQKTSKATPRLIQPEMRWKSVSLAKDSQRAACAVSAAGELYCWGANTDGRLGFEPGDDGPVDQASAPRQVRRAGEAAGEAEPLEWAKVSVGKHASCGLTEAGELYCWGRAEESGGARRAAPTEPVEPPGEEIKWVDVSVSNGSVYALTDEPEVDNAYAWGKGMLGLGDEASIDTPTNLKIRLKQLDSSEDERCGVSASHEILCWGESSSGWLIGGLSDLGCSWGFPCSVNEPTEIEFNKANPAQLSVGEEHICVLAKRIEENPQNIYCWGERSKGRLGDGYAETDSAQKEAGEVDFLYGAGDAVYDWRAVSAGEAHSCAITHDGELLCWGELYKSDLTNFEFVAEPRVVNFPDPN